jgi:hypothetical protein
MGRLIRSLAALAVAALVELTACATGPDAVARGGEFQFVSPGGQTKIFYDPPGARGTVQNLGGESLAEAGKQISGPLLLAGLLAITAGAVSFASPCCLPLVPGYLAYLAGLVGAQPPPLAQPTGRPARSAVGGAGPSTPSPGSAATSGRCRRRAVPS